MEGFVHEDARASHVNKFAPLLNTTSWSRNYFVLFKTCKGGNLLWCQVLICPRLKPQIQNILFIESNWRPLHKKSGLGLIYLPQSQFLLNIVYVQWKIKLSQCNLKSQESLLKLIKLAKDEWRVYIILPWWCFLSGFNMLIFTLVKGIIKSMNLQIYIYWQSCLISLNLSLSFAA